MPFQCIEEDRRETEIPLAELRRILRAVHPREIENETAVRAKAVQILLRVLKVIFIDLVDPQGRPRPVLPVPDVPEVFHEVLSHEAGRARHQYFHM